MIKFQKIAVALLCLSAWTFILTSCSAGGESSVTDQPDPTLTINDITITEGDNATFTVTVSTASDEEITFSWVITPGGTTTSGVDYTVSMGTVTIPAGDTSASFFVTTLDDGLSESSETLFVDIQNSVNAIIGDSRGVATLTDNDLGSLLSIDDVTVAENNVAVFTVSLAPVSGQDVSFDWSVVNGTTSAADFIASSGTGVTIPAGATTVTISVILVDDAVNESTENYTVVLSNPVNGSFLDNVGVGNITDNDALPTLSVNDVAILEGGIASLTVSLNSTSGSAVTFDWSTTGGTAVSGVDFTASSGTAVVIPAGSSSVNIQVATIDDFAYESTESFSVNISNPTSATISDGSASVAINDNDSIPELSVANTTLTEGGVASFVVSLDIISGTDVTFDYTTSNNSAIAGADYTATSGTATILQGSTSTVVTVNTTDDALDEADEIFNLVISNPTAATINTSTGSGTITDNDSLPALLIDDVGLTEGGTASFTVSLSTVSGRDVSFDWTSSNGTALSGTDYTAASANGITIPAGSTTTTINVLTTDDTLDEIAETFNAVISNPVNATVGDSTGVATLADNDATPSLAIDDVTVTENNNLTFTVTLNTVSGQDVSFDYTSSSNTATSGADFTATSGSRTITAGSTTATIVVPITDDALDEASENFNMTISNPANATISDALGVGTITDNDLAPTLSIDSVLVTEGANAVFTVTLSAVSGLNVSFDYASSNGTAVAGTDYSTTTGTGHTIAAGSTTTTITVPTTDDALSELQETLTMTISNPTNAGIVTAAGTGTLNDNDALPTLSINDNSATEGGTVVFTVSLSQLSGRDITFDWATANGSAISGADYTLASGTGTITAGSASTTININALQNASHEDTETFNLGLSNPSGATILDGTGVGSILDDDTAPVLSISDVTVAEGVIAAFTVTLTGSTERSTTVDWTTANGTASAPGDYTSASNTLTFLAGETSKIVNITTIDDAIDENTKQFTVTLSNPGNATIAGGGGTGTGNITDDDAPPTLSIANTAIAEGGTAIFTISLSAASELDVDVDWASANNTATAGTDYTADSGVATILAGSTSTTVSIVTTLDGASEAAETFNINLTNPINATIADGQAVGTITDLNALPTLSIDDIILTEGGTATFTVTLSVASMQDVTFDWASSNGTALAGTDYVATSGTAATITAGNTTTTINVTTLDDSIDEAAENFTVSITAPVNATISDGSGIATLNDDDATPTLSVNDVTIAEGGTATFTVTLSAVSGLGVTFDWATASNTAIAAADFTTDSDTSVSIPAGSLSTTFDVVTLDDTLDEPSESFFVNISNSANAAVADGQGAGTITDNDALPTLSIADLTVTEGGDAIFTISLNTLSGNNVTFDWASANGTGLAALDYTGSSGTAEVIPAGSISTTVTINTTDDAIDEILENFYMNISNPTNATITDSQAQADITDNDATPTITIDDVSITEGGTASFTVSLSIASGANITFDWATSNLTALSGDDYTAASGTTATIPAGNTNYTININTTDDAVDELPETFQVTVSNATNSAIVDGIGIGTVNDNDATPSVIVNDISVDEGDVVSFTVTLSNVSGQDISFDWTTGNSTAVQPGDYTLNNGTSTITAGNLTATLNVNTIEDALSENSEEFTITLSNPTGVTLADANGLGTILDDDAIPTLSIGDITIAESGAPVATVTLSAAAGRDVTFDWATSNGTATSGTDYTADAGTGTIVAGSTTTTIPVTLINDTLDEDDETINLTLSNSSNATILDGAGVITITDNDAVPTLSINDVSVGEAGLLTFTVTLSAASGKAITYDWATSNGTAIAGADYTGASSSAVVIAAGNTTSTFDISTLADVLSEATETFSVTISNPTNATISTAIGTGSIIDDDAVPTLSVNDISIGEGGTAAFVVTLSAAAGRDITFDYATSNNTAIAGTDYTAVSSTATITAGSTTANLNVVTTNDTLLENAETYNLNLSNPSGAIITDGLGVGTITDNDPVPDITINDIIVAEGAAASFTITISAASGLATSVDWATSNGTAIGGTDYTIASGTAVIPAGSTTTAVNITTANDVIHELTETFQVDLTNPTNAAISDSQGQASLTDNDAAPTISINNATVTEGTLAGFTVSLSAVSGLDTTFDWTTGDVTAVSPGDYTGASLAAVVIPAGSTTTAVNITTIDDAIYESAQTFTVTLSNLINATAGTLVGTGTLTDNDTPPTLSINDIVVTEGSVATFTITQSGTSEVNTTVTWATANGTATQPSDYTLATNTATITAGNTTTTVDVTTIDDTTDEVSETFVVDLSGPAGATILDGSGQASITDNDDPPNLSISDASIAEGGVLSFTVSLSAISQKNVTFDWATSDNTANEPGDYTSGSVAGATITAGSISTTVTVTTINDAIDEEDETVFLNISNATDANIIDSVGVGTILDNDAAPTLSINDVGIGEGGIFTFTITQSAITERVVTVDWATSNGTAVQPGDYTPINGTATINPGSTTATVNVTTIDNAIYEGNETVNVTLTNQTNSTIADAVGVGTITENEAIPSISINDVTIGEGGLATFTITVTGATDLNIQFDYQTSNGTALQPGDYTSTTSSSSILVGNATGTIDITTIDDTIDEPDQAFTVTILNPINAVIGDGAGTATITDNDAPPTLSINDVTVIEGVAAGPTVSLSSVSDYNVTFDWATSDVTALNPGDYTTQSIFGATILAGSTSTVLNIPTVDDAINELSESLLVTLSAPTNATLADATGTVTLTDNDSTPDITIGDVTITEGGSAVVTVTLSVISQLAVTVDYITTAGTALAVTDYTSTSGTLNIPAGSTTGTITVNSADNAAYELTEALTVNISNATNGTITDASATITINDDETAPTLAINDVTVVEGVGVSLTVTKTGSTEVNTTFNWTTTNATAIAGADYTTASETAVVLTPATGSYIINIVTADDALRENAETFNVVLSAAVNATFTDTTGVVTLNDNDLDTSISVNDLTIAEGGVASFTVTLNAVSGRDVSFDWTTQDVTATGPSDYTTNGGTVTIPAGSTTTTLNVTTINDILTCEIGETFNVTLSNAVDTNIGDALGVATITDNDPSITINDQTVTEGTNATFTVSLSAACVGYDVQFNYATANVTAIAATDYTATSGTGSITSGNTTTTIIVPTTDDAPPELAKTFNLNLSAAVNGTITDATGLGTINDNDTAPNITVSDVVVGEGGNAVFAININTVAASNITVNYATAAGTAVAADFTAAAAVATIPAGSLSTNVSITTTNDLFYEPSEDFNLNIVTPNLGTITDPTGVGTITDNDSPPTLAVNDIFVDEDDGTATFTVTQSAISGFATTFDWATSNGTAIAPGDYIVGSGTGVTIAAGTTTATFDVTLTDNGTVEGTEAFNVTISNPANSTIADAGGVGTIADDDAPPDISIGDATVTEGTSAVLTITASFAPGTDITVDYTTISGTAVGGTDYTTTSGTATILAGNTTTTVTILTTNDTIDEPAETFDVQLSNASAGSAITDATGVATLNDDDATPTLSINDVTIAENGTTASFTVTMSNASSQNVTFDWATSDGTAVTPADYSSASQTGRTIAAGSTTTTLDVTINEDTIDEVNETFNITLSNETASTIADGTGVGTITDNDSAPSLSINDVSIAEGGVLSFTVTLSAVSSQNVTFDWTTNNVSAIGGTDYTSDFLVGATINAGSTTATININTTVDALDESNETLQVQLSNASNATISDDTGIGTINDDDATPSLTINDITVAESGTASFTVTLNPVSGQNVTFDWATNNVTAIGGTDYTISSVNGVTINAGSTTATLNVPITVDALDEIDETFQAVLSGATNANIGDTTGIGTITDDDAAPTISIADAVSIEGNDLVFTVSLTAVSGKNVLFDWATSNGTAIAGTDYTGDSDTDATITAGNLSTNITIQTTDDAFIELAESLALTLSNVREATSGDLIAAGSITDNEGAPTLSINNTTVAEGALATLTITLSSAAGTDVTVDWATSDGTATDGSDYTGDSGTATITAGNTTTTVDVSTTSDNDYDGPAAETITVTLSNPTIATIFDGTGIISITDDEPLKLNTVLAGGGDVKSFQVSPDSSVVVYIADKDTDGVDELYSVNSDGTNHTKISGAMVGGGNVVDFKISSDSSRVVYLADEDTDSVFELFTTDISAGGSTKVNSNLGGGENVLSYNISADSSKIVYTSDELSTGVFELYSANINGTGRLLISATPIAGGDVGSFEIAQDSNYVVYRGDMITDNTYELFSVEMDGTNHTQISAGVVAGGNVTNHAISANSSKVVYIADALVDNDFELFSVNMDGTSHAQLNATAAAGGDVQSFEITANSSSVIYLGDITTDGEDELYSVTIAGASHTKINSALVSGGDVISFDITPNSSKVIYLADLNTDTANELFSVNINGSSHTQLNAAVDATRDVTSYLISPDSARVVYISDEDADDIFELRSITVAGASRTEISGAMPVGGDAQSFKISNNSSQVVYLADQTTNNVNELYTVSIAGGANTKVNANVPAGGSVQSDMLFTPDSGQVIYRCDQVTDELFELFIN